VTERPPEPSTRRSADEPDRLDSWKDVATYLKRDVSTVQRWERREGLPVHRHLPDKLGSVYAFRSELDVWSRSRRLRHEQTNDRVMETEVASSSSGSPENGVASSTDASVLPQAVPSELGRSRWARQWVIAAGLTTLAVIAIVYGLYRSRVASAPGPEIRSLVVLPLENLSGELQNEVARDVAEQIRIQITSEERARMASVAAVNPAAHEQYLLGRYLLWKFIEEDRMRAVDHFNRAVQIDPTYAAPYAGLAHAWWMRGVLGPLSLKEVAPESRAAARKALELDDRLAEAYAAQAYVEGMFDWDWAGAERTIRHAVELDTNSLEARYVYALLLMALGRLPEAVTQIEHAAQLDPLSAQVHSTFGRILYRARKFDEAILRLNRAIELEPRNVVAWGRLGDVHDQMGKYAEALAFYEKTQALLTNPRNGDSEDIARVYAHMGMVSEARQMLKRLGDRSPAVYAALGEKDTAFRLLFNSVDQRINWPLFINADPLFDSLHSDPRWKELLRRMNFPIDSGANGSR
jgi:tetratricopeptide (TPR) repeat protein